MNETLLPEVKLTYPAYCNLFRMAVEQETTSGKHTSQAYIDYTRLNLARMERIEKQLALEGYWAQIKSDIREQQWVVISEFWCGDAAQNLPYIHAVAHVLGIELRVMFRDANPTLMDSHLTNGGRSIPKLVADSKSGGEVFTWGPRPARMQQLMMQYKLYPEGREYRDVQIELQKMYNADKGFSVQHELRELLLQ